MEIIEIRQRRNAVDTLQVETINTRTTRHSEKVSLSLRLSLALTCTCTLSGNICGDLASPAKADQPSQYLADEARQSHSSGGGRGDHEITFPHFISL